MRNAVPIRPVSVTSFDSVLHTRADGSITFDTPVELGRYPRRVTEWLEHWADAAPDRVFLAERAGDGWRTIAYAALLRDVCAVGQALLDRGLSVDRSVAILSANSIDHATLMLACLHVGVPCTALSAAYSAGSATGFQKLHHCLGLLTPGLVFAEDASRFATAIAAIAAPGLEVVSSHPASPAQTAFAALLGTAPTAAVAQAAAAVGPDTVAKVMFTSGSTGVPKGVITTHGMLCSNQQMIRQAFPVLLEEPPVLADWLPWSHCFGGNHNFGIVLANGGTFTIDDGLPVPGAFDRTIRTLREVAPTFYFSVPKGYVELAGALRTDPALRANFFSRIRMLFYAAASLPQPVWNEMEALAVETTGTRIQWMTGLGCTETAPFALSCRPDVAVAGTVGLPVPGVSLKLAPFEGKLEARFRGPNVTPGYWRDPERTAAAFDAEGYYCSGDALAFVDADDPDMGLRFDGRLTEDFKLLSGTWVSAGPLRARVVDALQPWIRDVVVAGADRDYLGVLALPAHPDVMSDPAAMASIQARLAALNTGGNATRVQRFAFLTAPLSIDEGELTDKGSLNQRGILARHAGLVETLYADPPPPGVFAIGTAP